MRRKKHTETAEEFRERIVQRDAEPLRDALSTWIGEAEPEMPPGVANRSREIWEPLLAIADAAGGHWPRTARQACAYFVRDAEQQPVTTGVRLLSDLRTIFTDRKTDRLSTVDILTDLIEMDEAPWGDINGGRPLDARRLARELALYQVTPAAFRVGGQITKGYVTYPTNNQVGLGPLPTHRNDDETDNGTDDEGVMGALKRELFKVSEAMHILSMSRPRGTNAHAHARPCPDGLSSNCALTVLVVPAGRCSSACQNGFGRRHSSISRR